MLQYYFNLLSLVPFVMVSLSNNKIVTKCERTAVCNIVKLHSRTTWYRSLHHLKTRLETYWQKMATDDVKYIVTQLVFSLEFKD